jgi:adenosylmethionine-8-amino-7-oxononanoate aminotransferase
LWRPYTPADVHARATPIICTRAEGAFFWDETGKLYIDGNSSWWVASLGHRHPRLVRALKEQVDVLDHVALGGITHEHAAKLAEELVAVAPRPGAPTQSALSRVFYTDNGSGSVEVAVKMCVQGARQLGKKKANAFVAFDGAFHGDTLAATALGGVEVFRKPFADVVFHVVRAPFPLADEGRCLEVLRDLLARERESLCGVVVEPMVQGAAGMRMCTPGFLRGVRDACTEADVWLVADEVFTGYGRTGKMWACEHAGIAPDIMCLGKTFASMLPMGATLASSAVWDAFKGGNDTALYYGHTFCGHPLGARLAREVLAIFREEHIVERTNEKWKILARGIERIASRVPGVVRPRALGMIAACDLGEGGYTGDRGWRVYEEAKKRGAYLRPLGDTVYVCPPLVTEDHTLEELMSILEESIRATT